MQDDDTYIKNIRSAGNILKIVKEESKKLVISGYKVIDLVEFIEKKVIEMGGLPAFPCNVSINSIAAHYTPNLHTDLTLKSGDYVKVDIGCHIEGCIADTAYTVKVDENDDDLIKATQEALNNAIAAVEPGVKTNYIGKIIEDTIKDFHYNPIKELSGHGLKPYILHSGVTIPNYNSNVGSKLKEGDTIAIEPFASTKAGKLKTSEEVYIFKYLQDRPLRDPNSKKLLSIIKQNYKTLPFAERWLEKDYSNLKINFSLRNLIRSNVIYPYNVLLDSEGGLVSQAENSLIVTSSGCEVYT
ncbi:MAG: Methionine aminopeptidase [Candidatus Methanofastidiosum methylothiophilum]|jgi:methionyl aminopeptidase|uniref:Methionine aminopeptidase n=1 Tax=Candidatus Methanofastidiosum methylothiophilum TaxID=1705564 RepID=A0A150JLK4_9EURY|nr:MAG: Methionine aminopeptidase [Candidatus Methanofastidiosum methylthiophilus]MBP6932269.1 type II methionyl aminopeptidase [Methanofastidiosum sp.]OQC50921.1 MAG: Methionine aminopeptidase [Euryarchaeota archaeon ADurb.Bin023]KYC56298.1 MAG: Methionine aminopeptidase [Candidatus Methanofastidiosum methylthiophilus]KYC58140.1 MAG: Methionine aminopeptidase [Candidatus Methanofastidiosum methylthiophilus]